MFDGLLGRSGFYSKCKSFIKQTRTRIEVVRRKRIATQKFLRKDIADLLSNGLETNAYGRVEGLLAELILSSCYDFIDHICEIILKHLPVLQKLRECPQDCREAVASLMFAAARFSDLPELRELRDVFQQRYGSSLEYYVNQKLVENITPKLLSMEKKVQLMQDIASEFSIWWDSRSFEEKMLSSSAAEKNNKQQSPAILHTAQNVSTPFPEETVHKTVKGEVLAKKRTEAQATSQKKEREVIDMHPMQMGRRVGSLGRRDDLKHNVSRGTIQKREDPEISFQRKGSRSEICDSKENNSLEADIKARGMRKEDITVGLKSNIRSAIPPPYVKPRKNKQNPEDKEGTITFNPGSNSNRLSDKVQVKPENVDDQVHFTEIYYRDDSRSCDFTPRRRSHRRKNSRSTPTKDEHYKRDDEEETMIDKLLLHYSQKPSSGNPKRRSKSSLHKAVDVDETEVVEEEHSTPTTSRSFSLPSRHVTEPETHNKVFVRASSFQPDGAPAKHVHPKLPNYDDFAARLAALRET